MNFKKKIAFIKNSQGFIPIKRDFICSLNYAEQKIYIDKNKPFYLKPFNDAPRLTFNRYQKTFRFLSEYKGQILISNEESAAHKYCIQEIAKLNEVTLVIDEQPITLTYKYCFEEIVLKIKEKFIIPDLLLFIRKPYDLALKWNRLVAIEIVVSHDLDGNKLEIMKDAKIPLIRIKANKKWGRKKEDEMSKIEKEKLRTWIKNTFKNEYNADLILDPTSNSFLTNKTIQILEEEKLTLTKSLEKSAKIINAYQLENNKNKNALDNLSAKNDSTLSLIRDQEKQLNGNNQLIAKQKKNKRVYSKILVASILIIVIQSLIIYLLT